MIPGQAFKDAERGRGLEDITGRPAVAASFNGAFFTKQAEPGKKLSDDHGMVDIGWW